ncbi:NAD(P)/FAD-dependent oxidoreductase [Polymorphobacter sp.]|uniref:NAD(P)/FAD-dependent oxidoreductase n=1 Tax=Polymorphobacter sp. TaxID=1909290 RepID=UPI003F71DD94
MARAGARVLLVEAAEINAGASGQNAGSLHFQLERRFLEQGPALAEQAAAIVALNALAVEDWRGLEARLGADLHVVMTGGLMVAETPAEVALLEAKAALEASHGLYTRLIDGDAARALCPALAPHILAACHAPDEGHADPRNVTVALAAAARAAGATLASHTSLVAIERQPGGYRLSLETPQGRRTVTTRQLLIAAGAWTADLARLANLHIPLYPVALQMNVTERVPPCLGQLIQHVGRRLSMKQAHAGNILIGGGWPARLALTPGGGFDPRRRAEIRPESLIANLRAAADTVPMVADLPLIRTWTGITAISADQLPIVGEVPSMPGLYVAAGGSAFTLGPSFARLLAGAMAGKPDPRLAIVAPERFNHLNSFMGQAVGGKA